jgi:hypothetical protein
MIHRRLCLLLCVLAILSIAWPAAAQAPTIRLTVEPFFEGKHRPGSWLPFRVTVTNSGRDVVAAISIQTGAVYETRLDLPRGANKSVVLYTRPEATFRSTAVTRVLVDGAEIAKVETPLVPTSRTAQVVGLLTAQPLTLPLPRAGMLRLEAITVQPTDLPERSEGLSSFDLLLIDGAPLSNLRPQQAQALADWVRDGGQLIVGRDRIEAVLAQLPAVLQIATVDGVASDGSISLLSELDADQTISATKLVAAAGAYPIATIGAEVVGVQQELGRGRVTVLGFSLSEAQLATLPPDAQFWQTVVRQPDPSMLSMNPDPRMHNIQTEQLSFALMQLPVLAMPPLTILGSLLALYLLVVGPGLYLVLRRLDRQAWGWGAIPLATLIFAVGTYGYGLHLRGNDIILNQISIVEPLSGRMLVRSVGGVFSPRTQTYTISSPHDVLFRPLQNDFTAPNPGGNTSRSSRYLQAPSGVRDLHVAQWSMSMFAAEGMLDGSPLEAEIVLANNTLSGIVRNSGPDPLRGVALVHNMRVAKVGDLQPGETRPIELKLDAQSRNDWDMSPSMQLLPDEWNPNQPAAMPAELRMQQAILDSLLSGPSNVSAKPMLVGWLSRSPITLQLDHHRVQHQQTALVMMPVHVSYGQHRSISLPRGWIKPALETDFQKGGICGNQWNAGWYMETGVLTGTFQLPPALRGLQIDQTTIYTQIDGFQFDGIAFDVYDWSAQKWVAADMQDASDGLVLDQPAHFFSPTGALKVRVDMGSEMMRGGCVSMDLSVEGVQP